MTLLAYHRVMVGVGWLEPLPPMNGPADGETEDVPGDRMRLPLSDPLQPGQLYLLTLQRAGEGPWMLDELQPLGDAESSVVATMFGTQIIGERLRVVEAAPPGQDIVPVTP